ncbi:MAG TPA: class I SAM-dependent methyltransferase [Mesorhizobium sp.]|jgi:16S rRNA (guanine1207-N2)-methyltransferase|nr:class I SAM-dependent methyltransferase [Mesorhizobium sp.]
MTDTPHATLFFPFEIGQIAPPDKGTRALFLGAEPGFRLPEGFGAELTVAQASRPHFLALKKAGFAVEPTATGDGYDLALVALGRHRGEGENRIAEAFARLRPEGVLVAAGAKNEGADGFRRRMAAILPLDGSLSKHHGVAFWLRRREILPEELFPQPRSRDGELAELATAPGMFSRDRVDPGSRLLVENLPRDLGGAIADFGAGWGFLSLEMLKRPAITGIDLYEADWASLEAARANIAAQGGEGRTRFFWRDLLSEPVERAYDAVVMNPPFHRGRAAEPAIGAGFIRAAARALKPRGRLFLVANRGLPYEATLQEMFSESRELTRDAAYKILAARK